MSQKRKRELRIRKKLHALAKGHHGGSWAARQASRRNGRRKKSGKFGDYR